MKGRRAFIRYFAFSAEILLLWLLQSTPKLLPELPGGKPFLLLAAALSFSACCGAVPSVILGAVCGVLADISSSGTVGWFSVAFTLVCFAQASLLGTYLNRNVLSGAVLSLGSAAAVLGGYFLFFRLLAGYPGCGELFFLRYLPRTAYTAIAFIPLYALNNLIYKKTAPGIARRRGSRVRRGDRI